MVEYEPGVVFITGGFTAERPAYLLEVDTGDIGIRLINCNHTCARALSGVGGGKGPFAVGGVGFRLGVWGKYFGDPYDFHMGPKKKRDKK